MSNIYDVCYDHGGMTGYVWEDDPKRVAFTLARYKFVAKMFEGMGTVLELGCSDGFGSRIVRQHVSHLVGVDFDVEAIDRAKKQKTKWSMEFVCEDFLRWSSAYGYSAYDGAFALDVFEHIEPGVKSKQFLEWLYEHALVTILGLPSLESQVHASRLSKEGHVNCMSGDDLRKLLRHYWRNVFMFSMNDEVVHTGFNKMAHYLLVLCVR